SQVNLSPEKRSIHCGSNPAASITFFHLILSAGFWFCGSFGVAGRPEGAAPGNLPPAPSDFDPFPVPFASILQNFKPVPCRCRDVPPECGLEIRVTLLGNARHIGRCEPSSR